VLPNTSTPTPGETGGGEGQAPLTKEEHVQLQEEEKKKQHEEEKSKWQLWKTIISNGIINRTELQNCLTMDLLCLGCLKDHCNCQRCKSHQLRQCKACSQNQISWFCLHIICQMQAWYTQLPHQTATCVST